jgi:hypothetical protein
VVPDKSETYGLESGFLQQLLTKVVLFLSQEVRSVDNWLGRIGASEAFLLTTVFRISSVARYYFTDFLLDQSILQSALNVKDSKFDGRWERASDQEARLWLGDTQ